MDKKRLTKLFAHKLTAEFTRFSNFQNGHWSFYFSDENKSPACIIPEPIGGEKDEDGRNVYAKTLKDEILKRFNNQ